MEVFDINLNFWDIHPQYKHIDPFRTFFENNEPINSSSLMWFLKYGWHPDSDFFRMHEQEKIRLIANDLLGGVDFYEDNKEDIEELKKEYYNIVLRPMDRSYIVIKEKLEEKDKFLGEQTYDLETFEDIDKAILNYDKQLAMLDKIEKSMAKAREAEKAKGDQELSEADKGLI